MSKKSNNNENQVQNTLVIVGIGASAGGLEALRALAPDLPNQRDITYVVAQHMDPRHNSMLGNILKRDTSMPVQEVKNNQYLQAGILHIIPPGQDAYMKNGKIFLQTASGVGPKPSIDRFFVSLAEEYGERAVGIILSGTGTDGAHGMQAIKAQGGITIAQTEATAKFASMPHSAISTGHVDLIIEPEKIGGQLPDLIRYPRVIPASGDVIRSTDYLARIFRLILNHTGGDFRDYKETTISRRIGRRMAVHKLHELSDYVDLLESEPEERVELHKDILISVTDFFRDETAFKDLSKNFKRIVSKNDKDIRIWVTGCATGQEAYSIAILLSEYLGNRVVDFNIQIFATDLDHDALLIARQGIYSKAAIQNIDKKILSKYFTLKNDAWQLSNSIRDMVLFAKHDLVKDPPFSHLDLICCRNVLIYFNSDLQTRVLRAFHYALNPDGMLFLGKSETSGASERLFSPLQTKSRIYAKRSEVKPYLPTLMPNTNGTSSFPIRTRSGENKTHSPADILNKMLADVYQPDCALLDHNLDVVYIRGNVSPFLTLGEGRVGLNICDLVRTELRQELRTLIYKAKRESGGLVSGKRSQLIIDEKPLAVRLKICQFDNMGSENQLLLVFEQLPIEDEAIKSVSAAPVDRNRIKSLEDELNETRESLQTTIEELETSNEELQSTYEEAQSTNEELYTSTEELQTSNEELQSTNEELRTVNQEVAVKNAEIEDANERLLTINEQLEKEIEERKRVEKRLEEQKQKLRMIIDSEPAWVNVCDSQGKILEVNPAGLEIMEADSGDQLIGRNLLDFVSPEYKEEILSCQKQIDRGGVYKRAVELNTIKGNSRWLEISTVRLPTGIGDDVRIMSIICDQTEFKRAQDNLMQRQQELAQLMRFNTLGAMASGLAHEINQPLSAIGNYINGCEHRLRVDSCGKDEILDVLSLTNEQVQRAGDIINQVKHFIQRDDLQSAEVDINRAIHNAIQLIRRTGQCNGVDIKLDLLEPLPYVLANHVQVEQVVINLALNGIEAMADLVQKKPVLTIRSRLHESSYVKVEIADIGKGMTPEETEEIFKPFHTTKTQGMGMGLCISRTIVELYTGQLSLRDRKDGGTVFSFILPICGGEV